jgi:hypothetical protein
MNNKIILQSFKNYDYFIKNSIQKLKITNPDLKIDINILAYLIDKINDKDFHELYGCYDEFKYLKRFSQMLVSNTLKLYFWNKSDNYKFINDNLKYFSTEIKNDIINFKDFVTKIIIIINHNLKANENIEIIIKQIDFHKFHCFCKFYDMLLKIQNDNIEFLIATCSKDELQESYDYFTNNSVEFIMADLSNE